MTWSATIAATVPVACAGVLASGCLAFPKPPDWTFRQLHLLLFS